MNSSEASVAGVVGRGTAWMAATTLVLKGVGFVSIFLILNHLTVFEYGVAELILTAVPLLSFFLLPGLGATVVADMSRERGLGNVNAMKGLLVSYIRLQYVLAIAAWALVFFGAQALAAWYGKGSTMMFFQIISFLFLLSPIRATLQTVQSVFLQFRQQSLYTFLEEAWKLVFLGVFFFALDLRIEGLLLAVVLSQACALMSMVYSVYKIDPVFWKTAGDRLPIFHFLRYHGKWGVLSNYVGTFGRNIRPWIITYFLGPSAVGIYAVAQGLIGHTISLVPLDSVIKPFLARYVHEKERFYALVAKAAKYQLLGYAAVSIAAAVGVPFLIDWFFPQYTESVPLYQITLIMLVSSAFDSIFTGAFFALQAQRSYFWASVYKLLLVILLMPPMIYLFGLYGIAYANIISNSLFVWERYLRLKQLMPGFSLRARDFFTVDETDRMIVNRVRGAASNAPIFGFLFKYPANAAPK